MADKITSLSNPKISGYSKLKTPKFREESGLFLVEGEKALSDITENNIKIRDIFVSDIKNLPENFPENKVTVVNEAVTKKLSSSVSAPKIITVAEQKKYSVSEFREMNRLILLENISDPGNLGTIIRSAAAFGFQGIILLGNCVDAYNPKVIRSAAGNFFKIPTINLQKIGDDFDGFNIYTTYLHSDKSTEVKDVVPKSKFILSFGSEACGISENLMKNSSENVVIKTQNVESLNLAISASIIMYEFSKH